MADLCGDRLSQGGLKGACGLPPEHALPHDGWVINTRTHEASRMLWVPEAEHQPRERSVPCYGCRRLTWNIDALCDNCEDGSGVRNDYRKSS